MITLPRIRTAAAGLLAALAVAAVPASANAQSLSDVAIGSAVTYHTLVLDVANASKADGAPVIQWYGNGGLNQRWDFVPTPDGFFEYIVNRNSGKCLTTDGRLGHQLYQWKCGDSKYQQWNGAIPDIWSDGDLLVNRGNGEAMDVSGASQSAGAAITTWVQLATFNQEWAYYQF